MIHWIIILLSAGLLSGNNNIAHMQSNAPGAGQATVIEQTTSSGEPEGLALYTSHEFPFHDAPWELNVYASAEAGEDGELLLDDSARFLIKADSGSGEYILFDEQVQLGIPSADVFTDQDGRLHILITDIRTAAYQITDYTYDEQTPAFYGTKIYDYQGINGILTGHTAASFPEQETELCAFIKKIDGDTVQADVAEYITTDDTDRIKELNLTEQDLPDGYYIYNPDTELSLFPLAEDTVYQFIDWDMDYVDSGLPGDRLISTTTQALFLNYLKTYDPEPNMPFFLMIQGGEVVRIYEKPMA